MNRNFLVHVVAVLAPLLVPVALPGQQSITDFGLVSSENFNGFTGSESMLPANFSVVGAGPGNLSEPYFNGYYSSSAPVAGNHIFALDDGISGFNIAFGMRVHSGQSNPVFLDWSFINETGVEISGFLVGWDFQQFSTTSRRTRITAEINPAGSGWTTAGISGFNEQTAVTGTAVNHSPRLSTSNSFEVLLGVPLQHGEGIAIRWGFYDGTGFGGNSHIGVDNLSVQAVPEPATYSLILLAAALGLAGWVRRQKAQRS